MPKIFSFLLLLLSLLAFTVHGIPEERFMKEWKEQGYGVYRYYPDYTLDIDCKGAGDASNSSTGKHKMTIPRLIEVTVEAEGDSDEPEKICVVVEREEWSEGESVSDRTTGTQQYFVKGMSGNERQGVLDNYKGPRPSLAGKNVTYHEFKDFLLKIEAGGCKAGSTCGNAMPKEEAKRQHRDGEAPSDCKLPEGYVTCPWLNTGA